MEFTNLAKIELREGPRKPEETSYSFTNAWANVRGQHIAKDEALILEAQSLGNTFTITRFSYDPVTNSGCVTYIRNEE